MVMMCITVDDGWVLYTKSYGAQSTVGGRELEDAIWVKRF